MMDIKDHFHLFYNNLSQARKLVDSSINKHVFLLSQNTKKKFFKSDPLYKEIKDFLDSLFFLNKNYVSTSANDLLNSYPKIFNKYIKLEKTDSNYLNAKKELIAHSSNLIDEINKLILKIFSFNNPDLNKIKFKIFSINTLRIILDPFIIKSLKPKDHKAYMLWCIGKAINNHKNCSSSYISIKDITSYLNSFYNTTQIKSLLKHLSNEKFFYNINNDNVYFKGISYFTKQANYNLKGNIYKIIPHISYFRCLLTHCIAESPYIYDESNEKQDIITDDLNNNNLQHGRSLIQIAKHTSLSIDQVFKYLKFHPKRVARYKTYCLDSKEQAHSFNMNLHGSFIKLKDNKYYVLQRSSNFYHRTSLKTVVYKQLKSVTDEIKLKVFKPKSFRSIFNNEKQIKTNQTLLLNKEDSAFKEKRDLQNKRLRRYYARKKTDPSIKPSAYISYLIESRRKEKLRSQAKLTSDQFLFLSNLKRQKKIRINIKKYLDLSRVISYKDNSIKKISLFNLVQKSHYYKELTI